VGVLVAVVDPGVLVLMGYVAVVVGVLLGCGVGVAVPVLSAVAVVV
jgi:hypothetical protein